MQNLLVKTKDELGLRNYSPKTIKSYLLYIKEYLFFAKNKNNKPKEDVIKEFLLKKQEKKLSSQTINLALNSIKFLLKHPRRAARMSFPMKKAKQNEAAVSMTN